MRSDVESESKDENLNERSADEDALWRDSY